MARMSLYRAAVPGVVDLMNSQRFELGPSAPFTDKLLQQPKEGFKEDM